MAAKFALVLMLLCGVVMKERLLTDAMAVEVPSSYNEIPPYEPAAEENDLQSETDDNELEANVGVQYEPKPRQSWVQINKAPPSTAHRVDATPLELECIARGSPPPSIRWLRDNKPISQNEEYESNELEMGSSGLAKVQSRLIIDTILLPDDKHTYTCVATSGSHTAFANTHVYTSRKSLPKSSNLGDYLLMNREILAYPSKPRIVLSYNIILQNIGTTLVLPCKVAGRPKPEVFWLDNEEVLVAEQHPRMKVMRSGELVIQGLRWGDMGTFTCVAKNAIAKDSISTFVYPVSNKK